MYQKKLHDIQTKIKKLQQVKNSIQEKRSAEIVKLISRIGLDEIDDSVLAGALLFLRDKLSEDAKMKEEWLAAGMKFLRRKSTIKTQNKTKKAA